MCPTLRAPWTRLRTPSALLLLVLATQLSAACASDSHSDAGDARDARVPPHDGGDATVPPSDAFDGATDAASDVDATSADASDDSLTNDASTSPDDAVGDASGPQDSGDSSDDTVGDLDAGLDVADVGVDATDASFDAPGDDDAPVVIADAAPDVAPVDVTPPPLCPVGSTQTGWTAACAGTATSTPSAVAAAAAGDVAPVGSLNSALLPCARAAVCTPVDAPTLLFSDEPESPRDDGILYADTVGPGRYRVYVYHVNGGLLPRSFALVAENTGDTPVTLTEGARGIAGPTTQYVFAGKRALSRYLTSTDSDVLTLDPGARVVVDGALAGLIATQTNLVHAIVDVTVDGPVRLSVVSTLAGVDAAAALPTLAVLPNSGVHQRGTFAGADRWFALDGAVRGDSPTRVRLGSPESDPTLVGVDATTGAPQSLRGNFGMLYRVVAPAAVETTAGVVPRGGGWGGVEGVDVAPALELPSATATVSTNTSAVVLGRVTAGATLDARLATAGGASLPVDLVFFPPTP